MKNLNKATKILAVVLVVLMQFIFVPPQTAYAATSPSLGEAASFAVLAGTAVTNVPTSVITGDVGLSPAAGSNYAGLTTAEVSGTIYAVDSSGPAGSTGNIPGLLTQAKTDLVSAYDGLAAGDNATCTTDYGGITKDLVGLSLGPGVYCADAFTLTGALTLTGSGVWIFRSASTIITSSSSTVTGGDPCNVWWRAVSSATLGTSSTFVGNILALTSITMNTGASLSGRALARNGAVTLQSNTINQSCTAGRPARTFAPSESISAYCPPTEYVTPVIINSRRVDADSVFISWGPYSGIDTFIVEYGTENGNWLYNTRVTGFSTTLNNLPANQPIWVRIAATDYCSIGEYGTGKLVGGPGLPNTGLASQKNSGIWAIVLSVASVLLVATQKRRRLPSGE